MRTIFFFSNIFSSVQKKWFSEAYLEPTRISEIKFFLQKLHCKDSTGF